MRRAFTGNAPLTLPVGALSCPGSHLRIWFQLANVRLTTFGCLLQPNYSLTSCGQQRIDLAGGFVLAVLLGIVMSVIAFFIIVACAGAIWTSAPRDIKDSTDAALGLRPFGQYAYLLFCAGLLNASLFAACIQPLSTAFTVCEGLGFESGVNRRFREAPIFYWLFTLLIVVGAGVILLPGFPLVRMILFSQVINGVLLPLVLIFMILLVNKKSLMKEWANSRFYNAIAWSAVVVMIAIGIGFHNLGEGLAIGAAYNVGEIALGTFLVVGFIIQNITEGLGIIAPVLRDRPGIGRLALMGLIGGAPAIIGAWIGGYTPSPFLAVLFLAIGTGAIFQVVYEIAKLIQKDTARESMPMTVFSGVLTGMLLLWVTGLLIK